MDSHKYRVGQKVRLLPSGRASAPRGEYEVKRLLPVEQGQFLYRIKSSLEQSERVVGEDQLALRDQHR